MKSISSCDDLIDRFGVDGLVNGLAKTARSIGYSFRNFQTGSLRQYVMFIAMGTVTLFVIVTLSGLELCRKIAKELPPLSVRYFETDVSFTRLQVNRIKSQIPRFCVEIE